MNRESPARRIAESYWITIGQLGFRWIEILLRRLNQSSEWRLGPRYSIDQLSATPARSARPGAAKLGLPLSAWDRGDHALSECGDPGVSPAVRRYFADEVGRDTAIVHTESSWLSRLMEETGIDAQTRFPKSAVTVAP